MILVIDNYDSFTYNLVQYLGQCGAMVVTRQRDDVNLRQVTEMRPHGIVLSPGPGTPASSGVCLEIIEAGLSRILRVPVFGVCLGHQAIGEASGVKVLRAEKIMHGKSSLVRHDGRGLFLGLPNPLRAVRYHSLVIDRDVIPSDFRITATSEEDGEIMGLVHETLPIMGVQFHPESVMTERGIKIVENFLAMTH